MNIYIKPAIQIQRKRTRDDLKDRMTTADGQPSFPTKEKHFSQNENGIRIRDNFSKLWEIVFQNLSQEERRWLESLRV